MEGAVRAVVVTVDRNCLLMENVFEVLASEEAINNSRPLAPRSDLKTFSHRR